MTKMHKTSSWLAALAVGALLAGCGSDSDEPPPVADVTEVPASVAATPDAYSTYAGSLMATETSEPLTVDKVEITMATTTETGEPIEVK